MVSRVLNLESLCFFVFMKNNCYVYRHRRKDTNEVFYIGKGSVYIKDVNSKSPKVYYKRAYTSSKRSSWWGKIFNKVSIEVEIIQENLTSDEASELEIFLIKSYGRQKLGEGTLINLTDGGEGSVGYRHTQETKDYYSKIRRGENHCCWGKRKELSPRWGKKDSKDTCLKRTGEFSGKSRIVLDSSTGIFYFGVREAAESIGMKYTTLRAMLQGKNNNKTNLSYV